MPTTLTASSYHTPGSQPHIGICALHFRFQRSPNFPAFHPDTFGSHGDTILLAQIPNRALVLGVWARVGVKNDTGGELRFILTPANARPTLTLAVIGSLSVSVLSSPFKFEPSPNFAAFRLSYSSADGLTDNIALKAVVLNSTATVSISLEGHIMYQPAANAWRKNDE